MRVIGIICEYNPFHLGHLYQIKKIKDLFEKKIISFDIYNRMQNFLSKKMDKIILEFKT